MKITPNNMGGIPAKINGAGTGPNPSAEQPKACANMDTITLSHREPMNDKQFIESLKNKILKEVQAGVDIHRLEDLKRQIASEEYNINAADIARRIVGGVAGEE
jgi:anti-sigma28 factor (negative regulator of flagellin synthesis)